MGMVGLIEAGSELPVNLLDSEHVSQDCCVVNVGMVVPEQSPVMSVRVAAVPIPFPAFDEVFSPAVFAGGGGGLLLMPTLWPLWGQLQLVCLSWWFLEANFQPALLGLSLYERHPWLRLGRTLWMWSVWMSESC